MFPKKDKDAKQNLDTEEKKLVRLLDWHVLPMFCAFYFLDYLDRSNIGFVKIQGMAADIGLTASEFSWSVSVFYISYIFCEIPINAMLKQSNAGTWLASMMLVWGIITTLTAFVTNFGGFLTVRLFLGIAQSGFIPGILYQLSCIYKPEELGFRSAILLLMAYLAGIIAGPMAYGISGLEGYLNLHSWQFLFLLEGVPTILLSLIAFKYIFNDLNNVRWLSDSQKQLQKSRIPNRDTHVSMTCSAVLETLKDWKTWCFAIIVLMGTINLTSMAIFAPTLINSFGFSGITAELLSTPLTAFAAAIALSAGLALDRYNWYSLLFAIGSALIGFGSVLLVVLRDVWALYGGLFVVAAGIGIQSPIMLSWCAVNYKDTNVRAISIAILVMFSSLGSVFASFIFPSSQGPHYVFGKSLNLLCAVISGVMSSLTGYMLYRENCRLDRLRMEREEVGMEKLEISEFRYIY